MNKTVAAGIGLLAALALIGCADGAEDSGGPGEEPTAPVTAEPETARDSTADVPEDAWLAEARDAHLGDLEAWHREYSDADCAAHEPQCHDLFAEGLPLMADYSYWIRNQTADLPDYVPATYSADLGAATRTMVDWSHACPDGDDCAEIAQDAASRSSEVITEAADWPAG